MQKKKHNSDYVMTCNNTITSISNTFKKLLFNKSLYSSCIQTEFNYKEKIINNNHVTYVEPLLNNINYLALIEEWKFNLDDAEYEQKIYADMYKSSAIK